MSYTEIYYFDEKWDWNFLWEIKNSNLSAPLVWKDLEDKYLWWWKDIYWIWKLFSRNILDIEYMYEIWNLYKDKRLTRDEKIVLMSTFDNIVIFKKDFNDLINAFKNYKSLDKYSHNTLSKQWEMIEEFIKNNKNILAIWFNQTSINADNWSNNWWYDEEKEDSIPYNILTMDDKHWDFFEENKEYL